MAKRNNSKPAAFISYAHLDEKFEGGKISQIVSILEGRISLWAGEEVKIFIDRRDIAWGDNWKKCISGNLERTYFLIPILSPAYFNSEMCNNEYLEFREYEQLAKREDLIKPIYYVESDLIEDPNPSQTENWINEILSRQWFDFRPLRLEDVDAPIVVKAIEDMARNIHLSINQVSKKDVEKHYEILHRNNKIKDLSDKNNILKTKEEIVSAFQALNTTQQSIVRGLFTWCHPPEITLDDFFERFNHKKPKGKDIHSHDELYYRLKDLAHDDLIKVKSIGENTTIIIGNPYAHQVLSDRGLLST